MSKPEQFILTTDYTTFKNDAKGSVTLNMPGGIGIGAGSAYVQVVDIVLGTKNAPIRSMISSSVDSNKKYLGSWQTRFRTGTVSGFAATYQVTVSISRISANTIRFELDAFNGQSSTLVTAGSESFTAYINTFLSPFV